MQTGKEWTTEILPSSRAQRVWRGNLPAVVAVSPVDRNGNLGPSAAVRTK